MSANYCLEPQNTLGGSFLLSGVGLHTGEVTTVRVAPAPPDQGRVFVRVDLPFAPRIPAHLDFVQHTQLSTELGTPEARVRTVEHLLAALAGLGVDNAQVEVDGPEVPLLDGSAAPWVEQIERVGVVSQASHSRLVLGPEQPVAVQAADAFVVALPAPTCRLTYGIDFELEAIGSQWYSWDLNCSTFGTEIAPARTFGLAHQLEQLRSQGLIRGGSLDNALVCGSQGWLNPPLRFSNEPVRHKLLDLIGDLSLLGFFPHAHVLAYKASHRLHIDLARALVVQVSPLPSSP